MLCILSYKKIKSEFRNSKLYFKYSTHEMKNRMLSKNEGCPFFLLPKYINCQNITRCLPEKYFSPEFGGGGNCPSPCSPASYAYDIRCMYLNWCRFAREGILFLGRFSRRSFRLVDYVRMDYACCSFCLSVYTQSVAMVIDSKTAWEICYTIGMRSPFHLLNVVAWSLQTFSKR